MLSLKLINQLKLFDICKNKQRMHIAAVIDCYQINAQKKSLETTATQTIWLWSTEVEYLDLIFSFDFLLRQLDAFGLCPV